MHFQAKKHFKKKPLPQYQTLPKDNSIEIKLKQIMNPNSQSIQY
jgi:hypothetical protein